ncbi:MULTISPECIES: hypothetical protein [Bacillaceae]|uniref:Uncharacterized protein n=1 Tax=Evansella alkalicola TaxID=745819 RepID=A0ABS6JW77_9BACI|nr:MULTISPECIES: hypothetical protein [Bacillaceae]MBU9721380.1 hypothetical protein [Bacillus alkalicola]
MKKKTIQVATIFSVSLLLLNIIFLASQVVSGYVLTIRNVPDIASAYEQAGALSNEVSFGVANSGPWWINPFFTASILISIILTIYIFRIKNRVAS